jgi:hypothetical protein
MIPVKPFDMFKKKTLETPETSQLDNTEIRSQFSQLSNKKLKKFVKKAEKVYDQHVEASGHTKRFASFVTHLNKKEQTILFESYGLPEKLPYNSMYYWLKLKGPAGTANDWHKMNSDEKETIHKEYKQFANLHASMFFEFARNLPEKRCIDYQLSLTGEKKSEHVVEEETPETAKPKITKRLTSFRNPMQVYRETLPNLSFDECRKNWRAMKDKKKIKYIKEAEEIYNANRDQPDRPELFKLFNQNEWKILLESYGQPEPVPENPSSYYFKLHSHEFPGRTKMKRVFEKFRTLTDEERKAYNLKHHEDLMAFAKNYSEFLINLPDSVKSDYEAWKIQRGIKRKIVKKEDGTTVDQANLDESDLKLELLEENESESEKETLLMLPPMKESSPKKEHGTPKKDNMPPLKSPGNEKTEDQQAQAPVSTEIQEFIVNGPRKPQNTLVVFLEEKIKWHPIFKMNNADSVAFLIKSFNEWNSLNETEKSSFEKKFKSLKKEFKNKIKEFLMNKSITEISFNGLSQKIMEHAAVEGHSIKFVNDDSSDSVEEVVLSKNQKIDLSVNEIDLMSDFSKQKLQDFFVNGESKRKPINGNDELIANKKSKQ